jgi:heme oxygenase
MQQRFDLWRQVRADLKQATPEQKLEIEAFLAVLEDVLQERGYLSFVSRALDIEARVSRAARIVSAVPQYIAIEILERTETARDQIERSATRRVEKEIR